MARLKILREEIDEITSIANKLAKRVNARFELNSARVEIIESFVSAAESSDEDYVDDDRKHAKIA